MDIYIYPHHKVSIAFQIRDLDWMTAVSEEAKRLHRGQGSFKAPVLALVIPG